MGLLLAIDRRIPTTSRTCATASGTSSATARPAGCSDPRWASSDSGSIGLAVAERAAAFGIKVADAGQARPCRARRGAGRGAGHHDVRVAGRAAVVVRHREPPRPVREADTRHLVDASFLAQLRPGAILLNTSRGDVVDEQRAARGARRGCRARRAGRVRGRAELAARVPGTRALARHPACRRHPPHRRLDGAGAARHRRRGDRDRRGVHGRGGPPLREPRDAAVSARSR